MADGDEIQGADIQFAYRGVHRSAAIHRAESTLSGMNGRSEAARAWAALLDLIYADRFTDVSAHCDRMVREGRPSRSMLQVITLVRARVASLTGDTDAAVADMKVLLAEGVPAALHGRTVAWLVAALVQAGDTEQAYRLVLGDRAAPIETLSDRAHLLAARGALYLAGGRIERSLADYLECGRVLTTLNVTNPAVIPWRSRASLVALALDRTDLATALAEEELAAARRWGSPGAVGCALHALGMALRDHRSTELLERSVELLELVNARHELVPTLCDLGLLYAERGDTAGARATLAAAADSVAGNTAWSRRIETVLSMIGDRRHTLELTKQERKIAGLARDGHRNKAIAEIMFLTVRTVEFHLSNVYRKLGISGRHELHEAMTTRSCA
ncbi:helix-turn-helix transcriptional regulator [Nocardia goodfellowii]